MDEIKQSIVSTTVKYFNNLRYLAIDDKQLANDLMLLTISDEVFDWASWHNASQKEQLKIKKFRKDIIRNNPKIIEELEQTNKFYKNINLPQTIYTWQLVYDNPDTQTFDEIETIVNPPFIMPYFYGVSSTKPTANQSLINSGTMIFEYSDDDLVINFNSTNNQYLWFAIPAESTSKTRWYLDVINNGVIGEQNNLFNDEQFVNINIPNSLLRDKSYKVYITNYSTEVQTLELRNL